MSNPQQSEAGRRRDSVATRAALLEAAAVAFAERGFESTTVREIAAIAGVSFTLVNRYFDTKARLFRECLELAVGELLATAGSFDDLEQPAAAIARDLASSSSVERPRGRLLLLMLRPLSDPEAETARLQLLHRLTLELVEVAARDGRVLDDDTELRAQLVIAAALGAAAFGASGLQPLVGASEQRLRGAFIDLIRGLIV